MDLQLIFVTIHLIGFALGVGGATASDLIFVKSIKDGKVTRSEYNLITGVSTIVWSSVAILLISGLILMALENARYGMIPRLNFSFFQLKATAFGVLTLNGIIFHTYVFPLLKQAVSSSFRAPEIRKRYGLFAATGGVSIVSWYTAFFAVAFSRVLIDYSYPLLASVYALLVIGAGIGAYLVINMHAEEQTNPLKGIALIWRRPFTLTMLLIAGLLAAAIGLQLMAMGNS